MTARESSGLWGPSRVQPVLLLVTGSPFRALGPVGLIMVLPTMILRFVNQIRCRVGRWVVRKRFPRSYFVANQITPDTTVLVRHNPRRLRRDGSPALSLWRLPRR